MSEPPEHKSEEKSTGFLSIGIMILLMIVLPVLAILWAAHKLSQIH
jgi:hypothetical protein